MNFLISHRTSQPCVVLCVNVEVLGGVTQRRSWRSTKWKKPKSD